jgi:hypothetical protein
MFNPSKDDVRRFFCQTFAKEQARQILTPLENIAARWIAEHPEYHTLLADENLALTAEFAPEAGRTNPFLHLSMHLSISEQVQVDQPRGLKVAYEALLTRLGDPHAAHHELMECLGEMLWTAQRNQQAPDGAGYVRCARRRAGLPELAA